MSTHFIVIALIRDLGEIFGESLDTKFMRTNQEHSKSGLVKT